MTAHLRSSIFNLPFAGGDNMNPIVIKLGGAAGVQAAPVLADIASLVADGWPLVLVHGTSAAVDGLAARMGVPVRQITSPSGHVSRHTDPEMLEIRDGRGRRRSNKALVAGLQQLGCNALGLSGVDGRLLIARRKDAARGGGRPAARHPRRLHRADRGGRRRPARPAAPHRAHARRRAAGRRVCATATPAASGSTWTATGPRP